MLRRIFLQKKQSPASLLNRLLDLFFPNLCLACSRHMPPKQEILCLFCQYKLPLTDYHLLAENPFTERFWGRLPLQNGTSLYHFEKGGRVQRLIHQLKYHHQPEIAYRLGQLHGQSLTSSPYFSGIDLIVPVPLHPKKQHQRGYNQSDYYARGLADSMELPWSAKVLVRKTHTQTQTQKSRLERFDNVGAVFELNQPEKVKGCHILLVDDVITTGATLEACGVALLEGEMVRLSMATIGFAS